MNTPQTPKIWDRPAFKLEDELAAAEDFARHELSKVLEPLQVEVCIGWMKDPVGRGLLRYGARIGVVSPCRLGGAA